MMTNQWCLFFFSVGEGQHVEKPLDFSAFLHLWQVGWLVGGSAGVSSVLSSERFFFSILSVFFCGCSLVLALY